MEKPKVQLNISNPDKSKMLNLYTETVEEMQKLRESEYIKKVEQEILGDTQAPVSPVPSPQAQPVTSAPQSAPTPQNSSLATTQQADEIACPDCNRPMKKRDGKYGPFWGCTGYSSGACKKIVKIEDAGIEGDLPF